jgi:hypothetical protein
VSQKPKAGVEPCRLVRIAVEKGILLEYPLKSKIEETKRCEVNLGVIMVNKRGGHPPNVGWQLGITNADLGKSE